MLDIDKRTTILHLHKQGHGIRTIAKAVRVSRNAVRRVLGSGRAEVPTGERANKTDKHIDEITELYAKCDGNLVRVWEMLEESGVELPYSTLTRACRLHGIGVKPKQPSGRYYFAPAEEMQHDTSPHDVVIGGKKRRMQCASLVLCFSRHMYVQMYPRFNRFWCKVFLTEALEYFGGAAGRCMLDNSSVVIAHGTGKNAVVAPEMAAFGERFGFEFAAHEIGDANRSGRVERPFHYIEHNFYSGREFADLDDLNRQAILWCEKVKHRFMSKIRAVPAELFQTEKMCLKPLPIHVPEVYRVHKRIVDLEGYVSLHANRYSAPTELIGRRVDVNETKNRVRVFDRHRVVAEHRRSEDGKHIRSTLPEHRRRGLWMSKRRNELPKLPEETALQAAGSSLGKMVERLRKKHSGRATRHVRRLYQMYLDYPTEVLEQTVSEALNYDLLDLERIERMVLRNIAGNFFRLPVGEK